MCTCLQIRRFSHAAWSDACPAEPTAAVLRSMLLDRHTDVTHWTHTSSLSPSSPQRTCSFLFQGLFVFPIVVPTATMSRMWEHNSRPAWAAVQGQRLEEGRGEQLRERETWHVAEAEKRKWSQWEHKSRWVWKEGDWKWSEWQGGEGWSWHPATWCYEEPTALEPTGASSSGWMEDKDETTLTPDHVHADFGTHRTTTMTPLSFQPQRHVTMVLGRPVMVLLCSASHVASM